jgi:integrase
MSAASQRAQVREAGSLGPARTAHRPSGAPRQRPQPSRVRQPARSLKTRPPLQTRHRTRGGPSDHLPELRHTFGTRMAAAGVPLRTIQHWMGHADAKTTQVYAHYQPSEAEVQVVDAAFS